MLAREALRTACTAERRPESRFLLPLIGARLKTLREFRQLSLRDVVTETDGAISYSMLKKVEDGEVEIGVLKLSRLALFYGVTPDMLLGFES